MSDNNLDLHFIFCREPMVNRIHVFLNQHFCSVNKFLLIHISLLSVPLFPRKVNEKTI